MPNEAKQKIFLDANILIGAGKPPGGPEMARVVDLVDAELITVLTTDLTIIEVARKHADNDFDVVKELSRPHVRKIIETATGVDLPDMTKDDLRRRLKEHYTAATNAMLKSHLRAQVLPIDGVKPSVVFDAYSSGKGFSGARARRISFPTRSSSSA